MNRRRPNGLNWIQIRKTIAWSLISSLVHMGGISISPQRAWAERVQNHTEEYDTVEQLEARLKEAHKALNDPNTPTQYMPSYAATVNDLNEKLAAKKSESQGKPQPRTGVPQQMPFKSDTGSSPSLAGSESGGTGADPTASSSEPSAPSSGGSMGSAPGSMGTGYVRTQERARARANDNCEYSATHNAGWGCDLTDGLATTAKVTGQVSQVAGAALVTMGGQQDLSGASSGSQADAFKAAQKSAKRTADIEAGVGAVNAAMGLGLIIQGMAHSGHAKAAKKIGNADVTIDPSGQATASGEGKRAIQAFRMNEAGQLTSTDQAALNAKKSHVTGMLDEVSGHIASEQAGASKKAMAQGVSSLVTGAQQLIMSAAHRNMANNFKKVGEQLSEQQQTPTPSGVQNPAITVPAFNPGNGTMPVNYMGGTAPVISGTLPSPAPEEATAATNDDKNTDPDRPIPLGVDKKGFQGLPSPGPQVANSGGSADSGASNQIAGSGVSGGNSGGNNDQGGGGSIPSADARYSGGGGGGGYAAGAGKAGTESGPDLASLMEKMMAGQKEEHHGNKPNLEEFARDPASDAPYSFLDKSVDIFQRVHQAYQSKAKSGRVALF